MRICELMEQRGIQRIQLADAMGVSPSCITKWVQGTALPRADQLPGWPPSCNAASPPSTAPSRLGAEPGPQAEKGVTYVLHTGAAADWPLD